MGVTFVPSSGVRVTTETSSGWSSLTTSGLCVATTTCVVLETSRRTRTTSAMRGGVQAVLGLLDEEE